MSKENRSIINKTNRIMKEYTVVFKEPIEFVFKTERQFFDKENCK